MWHESHSSEVRAPLVPEHATRLGGQGVQVTVVESPPASVPACRPHAGECRTTPAGNWVDTPGDHPVLGMSPVLRPFPERPLSWT